jgi:outer membrane protein OmpA-like peptidoglycan-associated protein
MNPMPPRQDSAGATGPRGSADLRLWLTIALIVALLGLLAACQTVPPAPAAPAVAPAERESTLRSLGFVPADEGWLLDVATPILFEVDRADLRPQTREALARMAESLRKVGIERVRVEGHTDNVGSRDYNLELSRRRAEAVRRELAAHGLSEAKIVPRGLGAQHPAAPNDTRDGRARNRRVTIMVLAEDPAAE